MAMLEYRKIFENILCLFILPRYITYYYTEALTRIIPNFSLRIIKKYFLIIYAYNSVSYLITNTIKFLSSSR